LISEIPESAYRGNDKLHDSDEESDDPEEAEEEEPEHPIGLV